MQSGELDWYRSDKLSFQCQICGDEAEKRHVVSVANPLKDSADLNFYACGKCKSLLPFPFSFPEYYADGILGNYSKHYIEVGAGIDTIAGILSSFRLDKKIRSLIDVGCGFGFGVDFARKLLGWNAVGVEPGIYGQLGIEMLNVDIDRKILGSGSRFDDTQFDFVFSSEVIEHVEDPDSFLKLLYRTTKSGGRTVLTTPAAEYLSPSAWPEQVIASLSAGYHAQIFSRTALENAMRNVGFDRVRVVRKGDRLIAIGGKNCGPLRFNIDVITPAKRSQYFEYLETLAKSVTKPWVRDGALFRLYKELVNAGQFQRAEVIWLKLIEGIEKSYKNNFFEETNLNEILKISGDFESYGNASPYFLTPLLFYRGMQLLNFHNLPNAAVTALSQALRQALVDIDREHAYFVESSSLLWPIKLNLGTALLRNQQREEALNHFNDIVRGDLAKESPWDRSLIKQYIVSRALKESAVTKLQLGQTAEAREILKNCLSRPEELENLGLHKEIRRLQKLTLS